MEWVTAGRVRLLGTAAGVLLVLALICLLIGGLLFDALAGLLAFVAAASGVVAVLTWASERRGDTTATDLWDHDTSSADRPEDVFRGFSGFRGDDPEFRAH